MSSINDKQKSLFKPQTKDQRIILMRNVSKYPRLYKNEFLHTPFLSRQEKQEIWAKIAKESGFKKIEDAKSKWRWLINYLRQHLDAVLQKKVRRYIPNTDNPDDKYVQLNDWPLYNELEFVVPYVKYAASKINSNVEITPNEMDVILEGIEEEIDNDTEPKENDKANEIKLQLDLKSNKQNKNEEEKDGNSSIILNHTEEMKEDDKILKEYFDNMLKSTLKLPRFHQNCIRQKLLDTINEQKEEQLNKI